MLAVQEWTTEQLLVAKAYLSAQINKGDLIGHDFHGNRYTGGLGSVEHQGAVERSLTHGPALQGSQIGRGAQYATLADKLRKEGGFTYPQPKDGYVVGIKGYGKIIEGYASAQEIEEYDKLNRRVGMGSAAGRTPIGGWYSNGKTYLDVVSNVQDLKVAIRIGKDNNQIAIWDVVAQQEIPTGGTGSLTKGEGAGHDFRGNRYTGGIGGSDKIGSRGWIIPNGQFVSVGKFRDHGTIIEKDPPLAEKFRAEAKPFQTTQSWLIDKGWVRVQTDESGQQGFQFGPKASSKQYAKVEDFIRSQGIGHKYYADYVGGGKRVKNSPFDPSGHGKDAKTIEVNPANSNDPIWGEGGLEAYFRKWTESDLTKGESEGHDFRGNRYTGGIPGETEKDMGRSGTERIETLDEAIQLLGEGKGIEFSRPEHAVTLLRVLGQMAQEAKAQGKEAKVYDLCKVSVAGTNLFCGQNMHIPRSQMPQLKGVPTKGSYADKFFTKDSRGEVDLAPAFRTYLESQGHTVSDTTEYADRLRASQREMNGAKVAAMMDIMDKGQFVGTGRLFVSADNYIIDGHHTWAATVGQQIDQHTMISMPVSRIDMPILQTLASANVFALTMGMPRADVATMTVSKGVSLDEMFEIMDVRRWAEGITKAGFLGKGDVVGHDFHGNRYTGGMGITPYISDTKTPHPIFDGSHLHQFTETQKNVVLGQLAKSGVTYQSMHTNMVGLYGRAQTSGAMASKDWYQVQNEKIQSIAQKYNIPVDRVYAATAALSPNSEWDHTFADGTVKETNLGRALVVIQETLDHPEVNAADLSKSFNSGGLHSSAAVAIGVLRGTGTPDELLGGIKVRNFYDNLANPHTDGPITIDRHMVEALVSPDGRSTVAQTTADRLLYGSYGKTGVGNRGAYPIFAQSILDFAHENGMQGQEMQAILWTQWRGERPGSVVRSKAATIDPYDSDSERAEWDDTLPGAKDELPGDPYAAFVLAQSIPLSEQFVQITKPVMAKSSVIVHSHDTKLQRVIDRLRPLKRERAVVINAKGMIVWEKDGGHDFVPLKELEHKDLEGAVFLHNHPSGVSLSVDDVGSACAFHLAAVYAIGKTGYTYKMEPPAGHATFDPSMWSKIREAGEAADQAVRKQFTRGLKTGSLDVDDANINHWNYVLKAVAAATGLRYTRTGKGFYNLPEIKATHHSHIPVYDKKGVSPKYQEPHSLSVEANTTFRLLHDHQQRGTKPPKAITNSDVDSPHGLQKGEGAGHDFRGNRYTGGIGGGNISSSRRDSLPGTLAERANIPADWLAQTRAAAGLPASRPASLAALVTAKVYEDKWRQEQPRVEAAVIVSRDGTVLIEKGGNESRIEFTPEDGARMQGAEIISHYHPDAIKSDGTHVPSGTLSSTDIRTAASFNVTEIHAVDSQNTFIARVPKGWVSEGHKAAWDKFNGDSQRYINAQFPKDEEFQRIFGGGSNRSDVWSQAINDQLEKFTTLFAKKTGIDYQRIPK